MPLAISDCLNFGSPEDPDVMWQFAEACRGLKDACAELGIPVTGGNVSLYNQTGETAILPTPVVAVLGVIDDVTRRTPIGVRRGGRADLPARRDPRGAVRARSGRTSCTATSAARRRIVDLAAERSLAELLHEAVGLVTSAHDLSDGGLAQALVECALRNDIGATVTLAGDPFVALFSRVGRPCWSPSPRPTAERLTALAARHGVPAHRARRHRWPRARGRRAASTSPCSSVRDAWTATLPAVLG